MPVCVCVYSECQRHGKLRANNKLKILHAQSTNFSILALAFPVVVERGFLSRGVFGCIAVMMFLFLRSVFVIELMPGIMRAILCIIYVMVLGNGSNDDGSR